MTFIPLTEKVKKRIEGNDSGQILLLGDWPGNVYDGAAKTVLEKCLHAAGLTTYDCAFASLFDSEREAQGYFREKPSFRVTRFPKAQIEELMPEVRAHPARIVMSAGRILTKVLLGMDESLVAIRGYPFHSNYCDGDQIVIPCLEPGDMVWSNYIWRHYLNHDLKKAARYAKDGYERPKLDLRYNLSFGELMQWLALVGGCKRTSVDIEVSNFEVSCIGFTISNSVGISIAFDERWTVEEEVAIWKQVAAILENPNIEKVGQNFIFDIYFLAYKMGIYTRGHIIDTMMSHSIMYPEFLKGLGFLGSIYTDLPYWKNMVKFKNPKKEA